jgi:hypothetical protein
MERFTQQDDFTTSTLNCLFLLFLHLPRSNTFLSSLCDRDVGSSKGMWLPLLIEAESAPQPISTVILPLCLIGGDGLRLTSSSSALGFRRPSIRTKSVTVDFENRFPSRHTLFFPSDPLESHLQITQFQIANTANHNSGSSQQGTFTLA